MELSIKLFDFYIITLKDSMITVNGHTSTVYIKLFSNANSMFANFYLFGLPRLIGGEKIRTEVPIIPTRAPSPPTKYPQPAPPSSCT